MSDVPVSDAPVADDTPTPALVADTPAPVVEVAAPETTDPPETPVVDADPKLKEVQKEAQGLRKRLRDAEAALEEKRLAELSETEQLKEKADKAAADLAVLAKKAQTASLTAAVALDGRIAPDLALPLLSGQVEFDEQGDPTNVADLIAALVEKHPNLAAKTPPNAGLNANPGGNQKQVESDEEALRRIYGGNSIDVTRHPELLGGGVYMPEA